MDNVLTGILWGVFEIGARVDNSTVVQHKIIGTTVRVDVCDQQ